MCNPPRSRTIARLRPVAVTHAVIAVVLLMAPSASMAGDTWLLCTAKRHVAVLDSEKFDRALAAGEWNPTMSEADAQKAITKLSATALRCFLKPGDKVHLQSSSVVRDPIWLAFSDGDESCVGVVLGKSALECGPPSDKPSW
jgi:hypothetical protein